MGFKLFEYELADLVEIKYGKNQKKVEDENGPYPILGTGGIMGYANEYLYDKPSVLIGRKGSISKVKYIDEPFWTVDTLFYTKVNEELVVPKYLYYVLSMIDFNYYNEGTTIPSLRTETLNKIKVNIPNLAIQLKQLTLLESIEEKLALNNSLNNNLESLSQLLFKRWFIDFEFPNEQGLPYRSSGGEMVENGVGNIPHGWQIERLESIANFKNGKKIVDDKRNINGENKIYGSNGIIGFTDEVLQQTPSIVIGRVGANCGSIQTSLQPCWITDNAIICVPKDIKYYGFLYELLSRVELRAKAGGSAQPLINQTILNNLSFILPNERIMEEFHRITYKNLQMIEELKFEIEKLNQIRDALLPKLLSGEIEIPDESVVEPS